MAGGLCPQASHVLMHLLLPVVAVVVVAGATTVGPAVAAAAAVCAHSPIQRSPQVAHSMLQWVAAVIAVKTEAATQKFSAPMELLQFSVPPQPSVAATAV